MNDPYQCSNLWGCGRCKICNQPGKSHFSDCPVISTDKVWNQSREEIIRKYCQEHKPKD